MVEGGNAGKRINVCIASTLRDWGSYRWIMVEFYINGQFVHFLVCGRPNLALTRRYSRIFTGAITSHLIKFLFLNIGVDDVVEDILSPGSSSLPNL